MLVVGHGRGRIGHGGHPHEHRHAARQGDERLDAHPIGGQLPLLVQLASEGSRRALAKVDRAAGAQRPAVCPGRDPPGAPSRQPAAVPRPHDAQRRQAVARVALDETQRPARGLEVEHQPVALLAPSRKPRSHPVVSGRAALAQAANGRVCQPVQISGRVVGLVEPARFDLLRGPRAAREDAGTGRGHASSLDRARFTAREYSDRAQLLRVGLALEPVQHDHEGRYNT